MKRGRTGLTLIEVMLAVAITGIVSGGLFSVFYTCMKSWTRFSDRARLSLYGRIATERIARDIRESKEIIEVGEDHISLRARDNNVYSYRLQDNVIYRASAEGSSPLVEDVNVFDIFTNIEQIFFTIVIGLETSNTELTYRTGVTRRINLVE